MDGPPSERILIIDDQPTNVLLLERILRAKGYRDIQSVTDPTRAMDAFDRFAPDLVLLDLMMTPLGGIEILAIIRRRVAPGAYLPVLVLTADDSPEALHGALAAGATDFLTKPFDALEVTLRIRNLLETRDLTLRLQGQKLHLEEAVRDRTRQLVEQARLLNLASDALVARDLDDRLIYWNQGAERLYGWGPGEVLGRSAREVLVRDAGPEDEVRRSLAACGEWSGELCHVRKDGSEIAVRSHRTLVRDEWDRPFAQFSVDTDVTRLKSLERQLQRAQRLESVGTLASGVAHDLNNMLTPILMGIDMLDDCVEDGRAKALLEMMLLGAKSGRDLVRQLLVFVRGGDERHEELHLPALLREVAALLGKTFPRAVEIRLDVPADLPPVRMSSTQLYQVVMNLCINARDAMPGGGTLTLAASAGADPDGETHAAPGAFVRISVTDTGAGIAPELMGRIFDPFFTTKAVGVGTGLGLSTTRTIVADRGGVIRAESEPGRGARFDVYLPAAPRHPEAPPPRMAVAPEGRGEWLLLVNDEESIREVMRAALEASGYRVLAAGDGVEAVALAGRHPEVALLVTDLNLRGPDGAATARAVHATRPGLPWILVGGEPVPGAVAPPGLRAQLCKPFTAHELLVVLRRVLDGGDES